MDFKQILANIKKGPAVKNPTRIHVSLDDGLNAKITEICSIEQISRSELIKWLLIHFSDWYTDQPDTKMK